MLDTEALWLGPAEGVADGVTEGVAVTFDRRHLPFARLLQHAIAPGCDRAVWTTTDAQLTAAAESIGAHAQPLASLTRNQTAADGETVRPDREQNYYLRQTPLRHVPMTTAQATRLNAALGTRGLAATGWQEWLSPLQLAHLATVQKAADHPWPILFDMEPTVATHAFTAARRRANDRK